MMDTQKAIEYFSGKLERTLSNRRRKAYEVALEALEKQNTAKEVKEDWGPLGTIIVCPECGTGLNDRDVFAGHCKWCGQKIKREE